jgi:hypothetical protein
VTRAARGMVVGIAATGDMALIKCGSAGWGDQAGLHPLAPLIIVPEFGGTLARASSLIER